MYSKRLAILASICALLIAAPTPPAAAAPNQQSDSTSWDVLGGNPEAQHYSALRAINHESVASLGLSARARPSPHLDVRR